MIILAYLLNTMILAIVWPQAESGNVFILKGKYESKDVEKICAQLSAVTFNEKNVKMDNCIKSKFNHELLTEWSIPENSTEQIVVQIQEQLKRSSSLISSAHIEARKLYLKPNSKTRLSVLVFGSKEPSEPHIEPEKFSDVLRYPRLVFWEYIDVDFQSWFYASTENEFHIGNILNSSYIPKLVRLQCAVEIYQYMQTAFKFPEVTINYPSEHGTQALTIWHANFKPFVFKLTVTDNNTCELLPERLSPFCDVADCYRYKRNDQIKVIIWAYPHMGVERSKLNKELKSIHEDVEDLTNKYAGHFYSGISVEGIPKDWTEEYYDEASNKSKNILNTILNTMKVGLPNIPMDIHKYLVAVKPYKQIYVALNLTLAEKDDKTLVERSILETDDLIKNVFANRTKISFKYSLPKETVRKEVVIKVAFRNENEREACTQLINYHFGHLDGEEELVDKEKYTKFILPVTLTQPFPTEEKVTQFIKDYVNKYIHTCPMDLEVNFHTKKSDLGSDANSRSLNVLVFLTSTFVIIMTMI